MMSRGKFVCVTLVICSAAFCETSSIFDFLKRTTYSSSFSSTTAVPSPSTRSVPSDDQQQQLQPVEFFGRDGEPLANESLQRSQPLKTEVLARGGGWGGGWGHHHDSSLDLYSLLGGLAFASVLGSALVYIARRNQQPTVMMMTNSSGRRRRRDLDDLDDELQGESLVEFLARLGVHIDSPWWDRQATNKKVVPFKLI